MSHELDPLKMDFKNFVVLVWSYLNLPKPTKRQLKMADWLATGPRRRGVQAFRGIGKSYVTCAYVVWRLFCDPQVKVLVVSASKQLADNFTTFSLQLIRGIPELSALIPREDGREAKIQFDVGPAGASKDPSVRSCGINGQLAGGRADLIIADDIEIPNNSQTQMMRDKISDSVKEFDAILKPGGSIIYLGTPQCEQSLYNSLPSRGYVFRIWPARFPSRDIIEGYGDFFAPDIRDELEADPSLEGHSTDPERFSDIDLFEREASYGRSGFQLQFLLNTRLGDANRYPLKLSDLIVMALNPSLAPSKLAWASSPELVWNDLPMPGLAGDRMYRPMFVEKDNWSSYDGSLMFIDPSGRGKDETGYACVKMKHGFLYVTAWGGLIGGYSPETLTKLAEIAKQNTVNKVWIESNFGDGMFTQLLKPYLGRIYPCTTEEVRNSTQKELRIIDTLEPVMNQHRLVLDVKLVKEDKLSTLQYPSESADRYMGLWQMTRITRDRNALAHDDRLDALAGAVKQWTEQMSRDSDQAVTDHREELLRADLEEFAESFGISHKSHNSWIHLA